MTTEFPIKHKVLLSTETALKDLISPDPDHHYSESELDAIEDIDPELALRIDRVQTLSLRQMELDEDANAPIDIDKVREAVTEARVILMQDGGDIEFVELQERTVLVRLKGACVGCPRATLDLKNVVERLVKSRVPGVKNISNLF